ARSRSNHRNAASSACWSRMTRTVTVCPALGSFVALVEEDQEPVRAPVQGFHISPDQGGLIVRGDIHRGIKRLARYPVPVRAFQVTRVQRFEASQGLSLPVKERLWVGEHQERDAGRDGCMVRGQTVFRHVDGV